MKNANIPSIPLAERVRPHSLEDFKGQESLLGKGKPLRNMIENDTVSSFIMWGPPGTGKTTIAKIIAQQTGSEFHQLNAVSSGVKDIRTIIEIAVKNKSEFKKTILFIDEIHRLKPNIEEVLYIAMEDFVIDMVMPE